MNTLRVVVVEDDRATRNALCALINTAISYECLAAYASVEEALAAPTDQAVHVVLLDIHLPGMTGVQGVTPLSAHWPTARILMLTVFPDDDLIFESIRHGAVGYLLKKTPAQDLLLAIRDAAAGGAPMSPEIARKVVELLRKQKTPAPITSDLAPQELRLLQLLADGYSYESAGRQMSVTVNTVRTYIRSIYGKLHVNTKSEAVSRALRDGMIR